MLVFFANSPFAIAFYTRYRKNAGDLFIVPPMDHAIPTMYDGDHNEASLT